MAIAEMPTSPADTPEVAEKNSVPTAESTQAEALSQGHIPGTSYNLFGSLRLPRISKAQIVHLTTQLSIMVRSGVDLVSALESITRQAETPEAKEVLQAIHEDVLSGKPFSVALHRFEFIFGASYIASVSAGEASGKMWQVLQHLAKLRSNSLKLQQKIQTLLAYPIALLSVSSLVIAALVFGVLPQFAQIFDSYGTKLPFLTQVLIDISSELTHRFWLWIPLFVAAVVFTIRFLKTESGRRVTDHFLLNFFLVKDVTRSLLVGRTTQLMGLLIESGVPLLDSLKLVKDSVKNQFFKEIYNDMEDSVLVGNGLGSTLSESRYVPPSAAEMLMTAEKTGTLGSVTQIIGAHYEEQGEEKLRKVTAYMEPAITVVMGVIVATIVLAVALPMFDLATFGQ